MNDFFINFLEILSNIENSSIFAISIVPYSIFLYYLYRNNKLNLIIKIGFSLTVLFVLITIIFSILADQIYGKTLVDIDLFHGSAEAFLTLSDLVILFGFLKLLQSLEVKNS
tara:strand:- start:2019 stop:2354 length:336 start_codon:yes stop_codon:yes gene_type:complete